jgi:hypothetical protein
MPERAETAPARPRPHRGYALLPSAILLAPVVAFLVGSNYNLARPEALLWMLGAILVGAGIGAVVVRASAWPRALLLAACLASFVDVRFAPVEPWQLLLAAAGILLVVRLLGENALPILSAGFATLLVSLLVVPAQAPLQSESGAAAGARAVREDMPPVLVLVLDEHMGLEGMPLDIEGGARTREAVRGVYERHGFRLYSRAYSQYAWTLDSLGNLFNFTAYSRSRSFIAETEAPHVLRRNAFLQRAARDGYAIRVYQSDYLDFCRTDGAPPELCLQYKTSSVGSVQGEDLAWTGKAGLIGTSFLSKTVLARGAAGLREALVKLGLPAPPEDAGLGTLVGPYEAMKVLDRLEADLVAGARGRLFLAHLMIPHFPYTYDADCGIQRHTPPWMKSRDAAAPAATGPESRRRERYGRYFLQVQCLAQRLDRFFGALEAAGVLDDAVVVVLGDHGTRANERDPKPDSLVSLEPRHLVDNFSALFAARGPGVEAGIEERPYPLVKAFAEVLGHRGPPPETESLLLFQPGRAELTPVPMPEF